MFDFLKKFMLTGYLKFDDDKIRFGKDGLVFYFTPQLVNEHEANWIVNGLRYGCAQYAAAKYEGYRFVENHGIGMLKTLTPVVKLSLEVLQNFGWGRLKTYRVDEKKGFMVITGKSTIAEELKRRSRPQDHPIDFMLGGLFAGALEYFSKERVFTVEIMCCSQKDKQSCTFVSGTPENIYSYVEDFAPEMMNWAKQVIGETRKIEDKIKESGTLQWPTL